MAKCQLAAVYAIFPDDITALCTFYMASQINPKLLRQEFKIMYLRFLALFFEELLSLRV